MTAYAKPGEPGWVERTMDARVGASRVRDRLMRTRSHRDADELTEVVEVLRLAVSHDRRDQAAHKELLGIKTQVIKKLRKKLKAERGRYAELQARVDQYVEKTHEATERAEDLAFRLSKYEEV